MTAIVVGVDGSDDSIAALDWAAESAATRSFSLQLVHCVRWLPPVSVSRFPAPPGSGARPGAAVVAEATTRCRLTVPDVPVTAGVSATAPAAALVERSGRAELVVVGSRGSGGRAGLGTVTDVVASYARCPVVVVPRGTGPATPGRPVVVGIGRTSSSTDVLGFAFDEAARRGTRLVALHSGHLTVLSAALTGWREKYPQVPVTERRASAPAAEALAVEALGAALVVVGARGRQRPGPAVLGPVSQQLLERAQCPVAVVRPSSAGSPQGLAGRLSRRPTEPDGEMPRIRTHLWPSP
ncbi:MAG: hypothetical protein JWO79_188 [Actinomycetia bacterium]|jgi:nucleotide-binding universal stress UspA family protein|nr:hypothetical protein [Actinomycetes bacterium]MDQ1656147.1 hypothetical protein [Cryptosporangiaceae bacterium]